MGLFLRYVRIAMRKPIFFLSALLSLFFTPSAFAYDTYDATNGQLSIPFVQLDSTLYSNIVITIRDVLSVTGGAPSAMLDTYNPTTNELTIPTVVVSGTIYNNVIVTVDQVVSAINAPQAVSYPVSTNQTGYQISNAGQKNLLYVSSANGSTSLSGLITAINGDPIAVEINPSFTEFTAVNTKLKNKTIASQVDSDHVTIIEYDQNGNFLSGGAAYQDNGKIYFAQIIDSSGSINQSTALDITASYQSIVQQLESIQSGQITVSQAGNYKSFMRTISSLNLASLMGIKNAQAAPDNLDPPPNDPLHVIVANYVVSHSISTLYTVAAVLVVGASVTTVAGPYSGAIAAVVTFACIASRAHADEVPPNTSIANTIINGSETIEAAIAPGTCTLPKTLDLTTNTCVDPTPAQCPPPFTTYPGNQTVPYTC